MLFAKIKEGTPLYDIKNNKATLIKHFNINPGGIYCITETKWVNKRTEKYGRLKGGLGWVKLIEVDRRELIKTFKG